MNTGIFWRNMIQKNWPDPYASGREARVSDQKTNFPTVLRKVGFRPDVPHAWGSKWRPSKHLDHKFLDQCPIGNLYRREHKPRISREREHWTREQRFPKSPQKVSSSRRYGKLNTPTWEAAERSTRNGTHSQHTTREQAHEAVHAQMAPLQTPRYCANPQSLGDALSASDVYSHNCALDSQGFWEKGTHHSVGLQSYKPQPDRKNCYRLSGKWRKSENVWGTYLILSSIVKGSTDPENC